MAEPRESSFIGRLASDVLGEWLGFRYFQRGSPAQPGTSAARKGSLLAAIYKANLTPGKRQQALAFNKFLEEKDPSGKSRLEGELDNDGLAKMFEIDPPEVWLGNIARSGVQHLQTTLFGDDESRARRQPPWWRVALRWICIALWIVVVFWIAFPQLHK